MDKFLKLKEEREKLIEKKQEIQTTLNNCESDIANYYEDFFKNKKNQEFKLYTRFPGKEALQEYMRQKDAFPLKEQGLLNAKELAEMIKQFYQFQRQKEYQILTIEINNENSYEENGTLFNRK